MIGLISCGSKKRNYRTAAISMYEGSYFKGTSSWAASVTDPELDESVTELRFVTAVEVDAESRVHIRFRLPTYWCSPTSPS